MKGRISLRCVVTPAIASGTGLKPFKLAKRERERRKSSFVWQYKKLRCMWHPWFRDDVILLNTISIKREEEEESNRGSSSSYSGQFRSGYRKRETHQSVSELRLYSRISPAPIWSIGRERDPAEECITHEDPRRRGPGLSIENWECLANVGSWFSSSFSSFCQLWRRKNI